MALAAGIYALVGALLPYSILSNKTSRSRTVIGYLLGFSACLILAAVFRFGAGPNEARPIATALTFAMPLALAMPLGGIWIASRSRRRARENKNTTVEKTNIKSSLLPIRRFFHKSIINDYALPIALVVAICSFFFITDYNPRGGIVWNAIHGVIRFTDSCPPDLSEGNTPVSDPAQNPLSNGDSHFLCGISIPYRVVLTICLLLIGVNLGARNRRNHITPAT
jgi:hypothetical protein